MNIDECCYGKEPAASQLAALRSEVERLRGWKAQQLAVEASWDPQAIGRLIGVPLGGDIRRAIKPAITALRAENERLMKLLAKADRAMMATGIDHAYGHIRKEIASALGNAQEARDV